MITKTCKSCEILFNVKKWEADRKYCSRSCRKIIKTCETCKVVFKVSPSLEHRKYCSRKCSASAAEINRTKICEVCGETFTFKKDPKNRKFCSNICRIKLAATYLEKSRASTKALKNCQTCGKEFLVKAYQFETRKFCSSKCRRTVPIRICEACQKPYRKRHNNKFCSNLCYLETHKNLAERERKCKHCSKNYTVPAVSSVDKFCSRNCFYEYRRRPYKKCLCCSKTFASNDFPNGRICKECYKPIQRVMNINYRKNNRDKLDAANKKWRNENKDKCANYRRIRKARLKSADGAFTVEQWLEKLAFFGNCCYLCKEPLAGKETHAEHRIPISRGGTNWIANIAPACKNCNLKKGRLTEKEFRNLILRNE